MHTVLESLSNEKKNQPKLPSENDDIYAPNGIHLTHKGYLQVQNVDENNGGKGAFRILIKVHITSPKITFYISCIGHITLVIDLM